MPQKSDSIHSILIVSESERFQTIVKKSLAGLLTIDVRKSASHARRCILERYYNLVVIDSPCSDEIGDSLAIDIAENSNSSVLVVTPQELCEDVMDCVTDYGVLVVPKPFPTGRMDKAIRYLIAQQERILALEKKRISAEEKMEELRLVSKAKILLVEKKHMTEDEAHRFIGKQAMNRGVSRRKIAEEILDDV